VKKKRWLFPEGNSHQDNLLQNKGYPFAEAKENFFTEPMWNHAPPAEIRGIKPPNPALEKGSACVM